MRLTKHHGLGNDFLVHLDRGGDQPVDGELARAVCDRYRGIGADGLIRAFPPAPSEAADAEPPDAVMELRNADGSRAEMSGNGIRCLVQALVLEGWVEPKADGPTQVAVRTDAGLRTVIVQREVDATTHVLSVDMGPVRFDPSGSNWVGGPFVRSAWASMGNPHLVLEVDRGEAFGAIDLVRLGEQVNAGTPQGANVHLLHAGPGDDAVTIRTYERGVGPTQACGTGACAAAAVANAWGLVGRRVEVHQPGGPASVRLGTTVELTGPATVIAAVDYPYTRPAAG